MFIINTALDGLKFKSQFAKNGVQQLDLLPIEVTVECAQKIIDNKASNRDMAKSSRTSTVMQNDMVTNAFAPISTLHFNESGELIDGQHRLTNQVLSGVTLKYFMMAGLAAHDIAKLDQNNKRTNAHMVEIDAKRYGVTLNKGDANLYANVASFMIDKKKGTCPTWTGNQKTPREIDLYLEKHSEEMRAWLEAFGAIKKSGDISHHLQVKRGGRVLVTQIGEFSAYNVKLCVEFFEKLLAANVEDAPGETFFKHLSKICVEQWTELLNSKGQNRRRNDKIYGSLLQNAFILFMKRSKGIYDPKIFKGVDEVPLKAALNVGVINVSWFLV